jgi:SAM-dependent methyltransferase
MVGNAAGNGQDGGGVPGIKKERVVIVKVLDVGCGNRKAAGAVGIDRIKDSQADIVWDLDTFPWPLESDSFDRIVCSHVLEHLENVVAVMEELHRIGRSGAEVAIELPHFSDPGAFCDPTHRHYFSYFSFDYFTGNPMYPCYSKARFRIRQRSFKAVSGMNRFLANHIAPRLYESRFSRIFPSYALALTLEIVK